MMNCVSQNESMFLKKTKQNKQKALGNPFHLLLWFADSVQTTLLFHNKEAGRSLLLETMCLLTSPTVLKLNSRHTSRLFGCETNIYQAEVNV